MATTTTTTPRLYVGTYGKYNSGSLAGAWLDLEDYSDAEEFEAACQALHGPGEHEFMFQDWEGIPEGMVSESHLAADVWEWLEMDDEERELLAVYRAEVNQEGTLEEAQEAFRGRAESPADWAEEVLEESGVLAEVPKDLRGHIDFESYARDLGHNGMTFVERGYRDVWVFSSN